MRESSLSSENIYYSLWHGMACVLSCIQLFATSGTVVPRAPLSMRFPRQEYWSGLPFPTLVNLSSPRIELISSALAGEFFPTVSP